MLSECVNQEPFCCIRETVHVWDVSCVSLYAETCGLTSRSQVVSAWWADKMNKRFHCQKYEIFLCCFLACEKSPELLHPAAWHQDTVHLKTTSLALTIIQNRTTVISIFPGSYLVIMFSTQNVESFTDLYTGRWRSICAEQQTRMGPAPGASAWPFAMCFATV
jgi:hypothetical protein